MRQRISSLLRRLLGGLLLGLPATYAAAQNQPQPVYTHVEQMPELPEGAGEAAIREALQLGVVLPFGTSVPPPTSEVVVRLVVGPIGDIIETSIVRGFSPAVDEAVLEAARHLPQFRPGMQDGRYVRVAFTIRVQAPGAATDAQRREATTRWQQIAQRRPGEADSTFVRRVLPLTYAQSNDLLAYAWRPSAFGKQLFFSVHGTQSNEYGTDLFVLDPYQENTYAVQVLAIPSQGDDTRLAALFFADANHDGRKDLLVLSQCDLREEVKLSDGEYHTGRFAHYQTLYWQYKAPTLTSPPQYTDETYRPDLDDLETAAEVRQALARPVRPRKPASRQAATKKK
jgi:hypothetical protein